MDFIVIFVLLLVLVFIPIYYLYTEIFLWLETRKKLVLGTLFFIAFVGGFIIYSHFYDLSWYKSIYYSLTQFAGDIKTPVEIGLDKNSTYFTPPQVEILRENYYLIYITALIALLTSSLTL